MSNKINPVSSDKNDKDELSKYTAEEQKRRWLRRNPKRHPENEEESQQYHHEASPKYKRTPYQRVKVDRRYGHLPDDDFGEES